MATSGPPRDDDAPAPLELYAINVLRRAHGTGLADDLMARAIGDRPAYLWVLDGNDRADRLLPAPRLHRRGRPQARARHRRAGDPDGTRAHRR